MTKDLVDILYIVKAKFTDNSDMLWTSYETAKEVRDELTSYINQINKGDKSCLEI